MVRNDDVQDEISPMEPVHRPLTDEPAGGQPSIDEATRRAEFVRWLRPSELPTTAPALAATAREDGAPGWVVNALEAVDEKRSFHTLSEVYDAVAPVRPAP